MMVQRSCTSTVRQSCSIFASFQGQELGVIVLYVSLAPHLTMQLKSLQALCRPSPNPPSPLSQESQRFRPLNVVFISFSVSQNFVCVRHIATLYYLQPSGIIIKSSTSHPFCNQLACSQVIG